MPKDVSRVDTGAKRGRRRSACLRARSAGTRECAVAGSIQHALLPVPQEIKLGLDDHAHAANKNNVFACQY